MSQENVEIVRRAYEALSRAGLDAFLEYVHPDAEYDITAAIGPYAGMYYGRAAIRNFLADYFETWEYVRMEPEDFIDVGDDHVVVLLRIHLRGKGSGVEVEAGPRDRSNPPTRHCLRVRALQGRDVRGGRGVI
jgi:ketosteroid isomerase-like protein